MNTNSLQQHFFQEIKSLVPAHVSFADEIAEHLDISTDSAYRRIRGEKELSLGEFQKLCLHYKVSVDQILGVGSNSTLFTSQWVDHQGFSFDRYLEDMLTQLTIMADGTEKKMYYEAKDFPPFHYFSFPQLASFKYYFWMRTILANEKYSKMPYEDNDLEEPIRRTGQKIIDTYLKIPSKEIWSEETINSCLRQIKFYKEAGVFKDKERVIKVYEELELMIDHIQSQAEKGHKFPFGRNDFMGSSFELYINEVFLGHNTILSEIDGRHTVFINHGVLNYMITHNDVFCQRTKHTLDNIIRKSTLISAVGEKERTKFFHLLKDKVAKHKAEFISSPL